MCGGERGRPRGAAPTVENGSGPFFFVGAGPRPARRCTRRVQEAAPYSPAPAATYSAKPGVAVKQHQRKFLQTKGPVARNETIKATQILHAGSSAQSSRYASPVNGVRGKRPMDLGGTKWSRSPSAASPAILWFLSHRWERNSPRRAKLCQTARRVVVPYMGWKPAPSSAPFGGTYPYPLWPSAISP